MCSRLMLGMVPRMLSGLRLSPSTDGKHTEDKCKRKDLTDRNIHRSGSQKDYPSHGFIPPCSRYYTR